MQRTAGCRPCARQRGAQSGGAVCVRVCVSVCVCVCVCVCVYVSAGNAPKHHATPAGLHGSTRVFCRESRCREATIVGVAVGVVVAEADRHLGSRTEQRRPRGAGGAGVGGRVEDVAHDVHVVDGRADLRHQCWYQCGPVCGDRQMAESTSSHAARGVRSRFLPLRRSWCCLGRCHRPAPPALSRPSNPPMSELSRAGAAPSRAPPPWSLRRTWAMPQRRGRCRLGPWSY
jgi:hypothetical protein